ncbi:MULTISPECIES: DMP19 family protein [unclassified Acidovorax]|uniref:DMP19 family protein n=1 Tax=unclassified Acidovorax TaxID=2684926 RepID=UPI0023DE6115|nr:MULTISPECIES: DMP19 family protein [unclassified Acidovorax]GKS87028.1 hypothetical protein AVMA1855_22770 [Acidovorax sp. SUPP1855]GKS97582.1 hypothetical protein AVAK2825_23625 [Acidovorax sp. SUPP2825]
MQRLPCTRCGDSIHPDTAASNDGLCMPCVRGNTRSIEERREEHRQRREAERADRESPEHLYWIALVDRVYKGEGFESLSHGDQLYYLLSVLSGEVHNGGFDQFFSNSSGNHYRETVDALKEIGDTVALDLLLQAKAAVFGDAPVPANRVARFDLMRTASEDHPEYEIANQALDGLDRRFWRHAEQFGAQLENLAESHQLYKMT